MKLTNKPIELKIIKLKKINLLLIKFIMENINELCGEISNQIEEIKEKITSEEYKNIQNNLLKLNNLPIYRKCNIVKPISSRDYDGNKYIGIQSSQEYIKFDDIKNVELLKRLIKDGVAQPFEPDSPRALSSECECDIEPIYMSNQKHITHIFDE